MIVTWTFVIVIHFLTLVNCQLLWWPFTWAKVKDGNNQIETDQKQMEMPSVEPNLKPDYKKLPPLPWVFTGSPNPGESPNWFLQYFKKGLQSFHMPNHVTGSWLPPTPSLPQPQKFITPIVGSNAISPIVGNNVIPSIVGSNVIPPVVGSNIVSPIVSSNVITNLGPTCDTDKTCTLQIKSYETQDPFFRYVYGHSSIMDPLLQNIYDKTRSSQLELPLTPDNVIPPEVVTLSVSLMQATNAKMTLIVGVFTGLSVIAAALATSKDGRILAVENPDYLKYWQQIGYKFVKDTSLLDKIIIQGATRVPQYLDSLAKTQPGSYDFIILDDYDIENYKVDYSHCFDLLKPKGIMIINNVLNNGKVLSGQQYRDVATRTVDDLNSKLRSDWRIYASMLPIGNGVMFVTKK